MKKSRVIRLIISIAIAASAALYTSYMINKTRHSDAVLVGCPANSYPKVIKLYNSLPRKDIPSFSTLWLMLSSVRDGDDIFAPKVLCCHFDEDYTMEKYISEDKKQFIIHCPYPIHTSRKLYLGMRFTVGSDTVELVASTNKSDWYIDPSWKKEWKINEAFDYDLSK